MRTATKRAVGILAMTGGAAVVLRPGTSANRTLRRRLHELGRRGRYLEGRAHGLGYRLRGRHPDPDVIDTVLADRVRSSLGGLEKALDLPRIHVMVEDHVVLLHGEVAGPDEAAEIERAAAAVSGVVGVESYLHVGLGRGTTRPSVGSAERPTSPAHRALVDAAIAAGAPGDAAPAVVRGILAGFADRIPHDERNHVAAHLPADVRHLFNPPTRTHHAVPPRTLHGLIANIAATTGELPRERAEAIIVAVVSTLRTLVPEEAGDVAAILPPELRSLWIADSADRHSAGTSS